MYPVANREIYNFRRVPGFGFWKGGEIIMILILLWVKKLQKCDLSPRRSDLGFLSSPLAEFVANRETVTLRGVSGPFLF